MAIVHNGTINAVNHQQIPVGYTRPSVTKVTGSRWGTSLILEVDKATVENADPVVTMGNILNDATIGLNKQIEDILAADYLASATVTSHARLSLITTNLEGIKGSDDIFKNAH